MLINYLFLAYLVPFMALIVLLVKKYSESTIQRISFISVVIPFLSSAALVVDYFLYKRGVREISLFEIAYGEHHFSFNLFVDKLSLSILFLTSSLTLLVIKFSHTYLHKEPGYQRFFRTVSLFLCGLYLLALAGTLDLFFAGWEMVGLSSFMLIAFYRDRTRPVKNALRIFSIYRLCDLGLLFGAIIGHLLWEDANHFLTFLSEGRNLHEYVDYNWVHLVGFLLMFSAIGKSAQFPFINWPARAMEGPTPSSAIFYGGLSIHCGVFLLYRTYPIWSHSYLVVYALTGVGLLTALLATGIGRIQPNIKGQLAYLSVAHIGIMFIELAWGFHNLVIFHFLTHSFFRCYQILTSPSSIVDHVKVIDATSNITIKKAIENWLPMKLRTTIYSFALQEGFLSISERGFFPLPFVQIKLWMRKVFRSYITFAVVPVIAYYLAHWQGHTETHQVVAYMLGLLDLVLSASCLTSLKNPNTIWNRFLATQILFMASAFIFKAHSYHGVILYSISAIPCWVLGKYALMQFTNVDMKKFNGLYITNPKKSNLFFIAFLGMSGFPFFTTFWGEDVIFAEMLLEGPVLLTMTALSMMFNGLISARILTKVFWGFPSYIKY
ncbi:MAG: hypothetical protein JNM93_03235 [Bacteriovoracaceae bacterium]|nr:hypothetical protein [Bacteriovoracaceae bacterium]